MKVCLVASRLGEGNSNFPEPFDGPLDGTSRITDELATILTEEDHKVHGVTDCPRQNLGRLKRSYHLSTVGSRFSIANFATLVDRIRQFQPDIVHFHGGQPMSILARLFKIRTSLPTIFTFTFIPSIVRKSLTAPDHAVRSVASRIFRSRTLRRSNFDHIIALTEFAKKRLVNDEGLDPNSISVVQYGVPRRSLLAEPRDYLDTAGIVLISGTSSERGFGTFLRSVPIVHSVFPEANVSVAVRNSFELVDARTHGMEGVRIIGPANLFTSICNHSIVVMPFSSHVAVDPPLSMLESMVWGKRVISTSVGSIPTILGLNRGLVVPPQDERALGNGMLTLLRNDPKVEPLSQNARSYVIENYDWKVAMESILRIYRAHC